jgi:hypothetical protein
MQARMTALKLDEVHEAMIQSLKGTAGAAIPPSKFPKLHSYVAFCCTYFGYIVSAPRCSLLFRVKVDFLYGALFYILGIAVLFLYHIKAVVN